MPGSVTLGHPHALVMLSHVDAERLAMVLKKMSELLQAPGAERMSDFQAAALVEEKLDRDEFAEWSRKVSEYLKAHL